MSDTPRTYIVTMTQHGSGVPELTTDGNPTLTEIIGLLEGGLVLAREALAGRVVMETG